MNCVAELVKSFDFPAFESLDDFRYNARSFFLLGRVGVKARVVFVEIVSDAALRKAIALDGQFELIGIANHLSLIHI